VNKNEKEKLLKNKIFEIYSKWREEPSTDRFLIYYQQLCKEIYLWCKYYLFRKIDNMGEEIAVVTERIMKIEDTLDKNGCFKYLYGVLKKEKANFYRKYNSKTIKIPKEMKLKIRTSEDVLRMKERYLGRKLTKDEKILSISDWFGISIKRANNILNAMQISSSNLSNNDMDSTLNIEDKSINHFDEYFIKSDRKYIREAVEYLINKKQKRARGCYRALFTLHCIDNYKDFEGLYPVLDSQILEARQEDGKNPNQDEIYQKYHPKAKKKSAEAMASKNLHEFLNAVETYLKEKNR